MAQDRQGSEAGLEAGNAMAIKRIKKLASKKLEQ
jgi:hypothetical protein